MTRITDIASLRKALEDLPGDRIIFCQVAFGDGGAWNMGGSFTPCVPGGDIALLSFSHPSFNRMPSVDPDDNA